MNTTIIIGDVHGVPEKLQALIEVARSRWGECSFYGLGDFIDRGPDSKGVIQVCLDEGVLGILGNHEIWFHQLLNVGEFDRDALHSSMGGHVTLDSYRLGVRWPERNVQSNVPLEHQDFILDLPASRSLEVAGVTYWLTHAGVRSAPGQAAWTASHSERQFFEDFEEHSPQELLWAHFNPKKGDLFKLPLGGVQVVGHTPIPEPRDGGHFIALDTGCGRKGGGKLSAVALHQDGSRTLFSV